MGLVCNSEPHAGIIIIVSQLRYISNNFGHCRIGRTGVVAING